MNQRIMELVEEYADAVSSYHLANNPLETGDEYRMDQVGEAIAAAIQAEQDYTRAVISERNKWMAVHEVNVDTLNAMQAEIDDLKSGLANYREIHETVLIQKSAIGNLHTECDALRKELAELRKVDHYEQVLDMVQPKAEPVQAPVATVQMGYGDSGQPKGVIAVLHHFLPVGTLLYPAPQDGLRKAAQMAVDSYDRNEFDHWDDAMEVLRKEIK